MPIFRVYFYALFYCPDPFPNVEQTLTDIRDDITESMQHDGAAETHHHQSSDPKKAE
jgi:hypothetical protein